MDGVRDQVCISLISVDSPHRRCVVFDFWWVYFWGCVSAMFIHLETCWLAVEVTVIRDLWLGGDVSTGLLVRGQRSWDSRAASAGAGCSMVKSDAVQDYEWSASFVISIWWTGWCRWPRGLIDWIWSAQEPIPSIESSSTTCTRLWSLEFKGK